jgi:hypothetical protein
MYILKRVSSTREKRNNAQENGHVVWNWTTMKQTKDKKRVNVFALKTTNVNINEIEHHIYYQSIKWMLTNKDDILSLDEKIVELLGTIEDW